MENGYVEKNISKKALSDRILANLRTLYNSNIPKVSLVKWSQNKIFVAGSVISGIPKLKKKSVFSIILNLRVGQKSSLYPKKSPILRPLYNRYFCHISIIKWSRICQNSTRKCVFGDIFLKINFPLNSLSKLFKHYA